MTILLVFMGALVLGMEIRDRQHKANDRKVFEAGMRQAFSREPSLADVAEWIAAAPIPQLDWLVDRALETQRAARQLEDRQAIDSLLEDVRRLG